MTLNSPSEGESNARELLRLIQSIEDQLRAIAADQHSFVNTLGESDRGESLTLSAINQELQNLSRRLRELPSDLLTDIQATTQLTRRFSPEATLPRLAGWALSPSSLLKLTDLILEDKAELVLECGSGTSTLWMAYAMRQNGKGTIIALEHKAEYARCTQEMLDSHGLGSFVEVFEVPLTLRATPRGMYQWYDFDFAGISQPIDMLVVDGPIGSVGPHARYPALPLSKPYLQRDSKIVLDDMDRPDEREIVQFWLAENPTLAQALAPNHEIAVLTYDGFH